MTTMDKEHDDDFTSFLDTIETTTLPLPSSSTSSTNPIPSSATAPSPLQTQQNDPKTTTSNRDSTPLSARSKRDETQSTEARSKPKWSEGLGSWFQSVVQETQVAKSMMTQNIKHLGEMTNQLIHETQTATEKVKRHLPHMLEGWTSDAPSFPIHLYLSGLCNVKQLEQDCLSILNSVFSKLDLSVQCSTIDNTSLRSFVKEEVSASLDTAIEPSLNIIPPPTPIQLTSLIPFQLHVLPCIWQNQFLLYICQIHAMNHKTQTVSQSMVLNTLESEWERLVLRSAVRASIEDWVRDVDLSLYHGGSLGAEK